MNFKDSAMPSSKRDKWNSIFELAPTVLPHMCEQKATHSWGKGDQTLTFIGHLLCTRHTFP